MRTPSPIMMSPPGARTVIDGITYDYFGGTSYLGLHGHPEVIAAACRAAQTFGIHSATSRSRYSSQPVLNVERLAASFFASEAAFYFVSGYVGTAILIRVLAPTVDTIFIDADAHYSVSEAAILGQKPVYTFAHRNADDLRELLAAHLAPRERPLVLTDGVFPSFGAIAPIDAYLQVLQSYPGAAILVDDAHGFGTLGANGRGTLEHLGLWDRVNTTLCDDAGVRLFAVGTLSKALGGFGGIITGSAEVIEAATSATHYHDGASAPPAITAAASARALQLVADTPQLRTDLSTNVNRVRTGLRDLGIEVGDLETPIVGFTRGDASTMQQLHADLAAEEILVPYAESYAGVGPAGAMRLAVFATHTHAMIDRMLEALRRLTS